ncbi:hypothetical protein B0H21DRAFT_717694 [Amylocystis lapponica]|nr:hypothetical protein B0H21DRAFT_717694 [Amylocystis lapponica]
MQVWAVTFNQQAVSDLDEVYQRGLSVLDAEAKNRTQRYFRQQDRVSRLLPRVLLKERGIHLQRMSFSTTQAGKPYIANTFAALVEAVSEQVGAISPSFTDLHLKCARAEALRRFYLIWTLKEAYTKALGLGLGFDFKRIEYDVPRDVVRIDGVTPHGWEFLRFQVQNQLRDGCKDETYVGVAARFLGDEQNKKECVVEEKPAGPWLRVFGAVEFVENAVKTLN